MISFVFGCIYAVLSILLGAFAHHALQDVLSPKNLSSLEVAARYFFYNSMPLLFLFFSNKQFKWPFYLPLLFIVFTGIFSGSIVLFVFLKIPLFAYFTPIGGIGIMASWLCWLIIIKKKFK